MKLKALTFLTLAMALSMIASTVLAAPPASAIWSPEKQALKWSQRQIDGFDPGTDITTDSQFTLSIAVGDVDGDGDLDVIAGNSDQTNRLYLNNGTANPFSGLATGTNITADAQATEAVALGDVDVDGDLDLVVGNFNQPNRLYLNNGTADPFNGVSGTDITSDADATYSVALGDMNGDGRLDLVVGNGNSTPGTGVNLQANRLYLNNGTANPFNGVIGTNISGDLHDTRSVALGDINNDGRLDVVAGNYRTQANRLYLNNGTADPFNGVTGANITADAHNTTSVALGDMNGDGRLDVVAGNDRNDTILQPNRLYLNNGTATPFTSGSNITADNQDTFSVALGDVDGDGDRDLVAGNLNQRNRLYLNNGTASPFNGVTGEDITTDAQSTLSVALGDMDGDGNLDLVAGNFNARNRLYLNNSPLAVTLASFTAQGGADRVTVTWETVSELNNAGFNLYRTGSVGDRPEPSDLLTYVASQAPGSTQGAAYSYEDLAVEAGQTYWYWLEDVDLGGATTLHGPVSATVQTPTAVGLADFEAAAGSMPSFAGLALAAGLAVAGGLVWRRRRQEAVKS